MSIRKFFINLIPIRNVRYRLRDRYYPVNFTISKHSKCLFVAPHPDDEMIGGGGLMIMNPKNFDCIVIGSSGIAYKGLSEKERSDMRMHEFNNVMNAVGIRHRWIFETLGPLAMKQMNNNIKEYLKVLDTKKYDLIFLPVPHDRHPEHNYITNKLFKKIIRKNGYKKDLKIVFYEVWSLIANPNVFIDITKVIDKKREILHLYKSAHVRFQYSENACSLNKYRGMQNDTLGYAEAFYVDSVHNYIKNGYKING